MRRRLVVTKTSALLLGAGAAAYALWRTSAQRRTRSLLRRKTVFITGGSRGLGFILAQEFARCGSNVVISARDAEELARAESRLRQIAPNILAIPADVTMREEAEAAVQKAIDRFGEVDVLVNNAGTISVGPAETMTIDDYRDAINIYFWGPYFMTMAVLPAMQKLRSGRIVNISSIGGKIGVPHLLPYSVGKFALTGFSQGLRSELLKDNVHVTTVCPGLMRTGSPRNAFFKGRNESEYAWFSISGALPIVSMNANRAARRIVAACARGQAELILTLPAKLAAKLHGVFPGFTADLMGVMNGLLPPPGGIGTEARPGWQSFTKASPSVLTTLDQQAARENNQVA